MKRADALRIIRQFEDAVREDEMRGSYHPLERGPIHQRYKVLKERMVIRMMGSDVTNVQKHGRAQ